LFERTKPNKNLTFCCSHWLCVHCYGPFIWMLFNECPWRD